MAGGASRWVGGSVVFHASSHGWLPCTYILLQRRLSQNRHDTHHFDLQSRQTAFLRRAHRRNGTNVMKNLLISPHSGKHEKKVPNPIISTFLQHPRLVGRQRRGYLDARAQRVPRSGHVYPTNITLAHRHKQHTHVITYL